MKNKQAVLFKGVTNFGQVFFTPNFEMCVMNSTIDPIPTNRRSTRALVKLVKGINKDDKTEEELEANRHKKEERKKARKASYISRRKNNIRKRAS